MSESKDKDGSIRADLKTLCEAPRKMIASGIGDTIAKYNAVADWKLANLVKVTLAGKGNGQHPPDARYCPEPLQMVEEG